MIKMVIGLLLLVGTLTRENFGFVSFTGGESFGYNLVSILMIGGGLYLLYLGNKDRLKN